MGRPVRDVQDRIAFQAAAGFDFIYLRANYDYPGVSPLVSTGTPRSWDYTREGDRGQFRSGAMHTFADLERIAWPDPQTVDIAHFDTAAQVMPPGMGIITGVGGIFTRTWMLMGYEHFSLALADNPELVGAGGGEDRANSSRRAAPFDRAAPRGGRVVWRRPGLHRRADGFA